MPPTIEPQAQSSETKIRFTTQAQLDSYNDLMDETRKYVRRESNDKTLHRVAHVFPQFTGVTGEDFVGHPDHPGDEKKTAQHCFWRCSVERFEEKPAGKKGEVIRNALGSFLMDADKFLKDFIRV